MIPNCEGCKIELELAYKWQSKGYNVALENMGVKEHCLVTVFTNKGEIIIE